MRKLIDLVRLAMLAAVMTACGGPAAAVPTPAPTATPVPPTATPVPPTATPAPPTATPAPAAQGGDAAAAITAGLEQVKQADTYRVSMAMSASGNAVQGQAAGGSGPVQLIAVEGDVAGEDSRLRLSGLFSAFMGADPTTGLEMISVGGTSYVRGPAPLLGAAEAAWYELPADGSSPVSSIEPGQIVGGLTGSDMDLSGFTAAGEEELDGQRCQVYAGDREATMRAFETVGEQGLPGPQGFSEVERAELKFWVCEDGYFHQLVLDMEGLPEGQTEPVAYTIELRMYDFDADIRVEAPADAQPLQVPGLELPTPTP
ncbi:MAG: hypothetical protein RLZZ387_114 [Chloroflexota bacterium]|jgi:hypothetical protein